MRSGRFTRSLIYLRLHFTLFYLLPLFVTVMNFLKPLNKNTGVKEYNAQFDPRRSWQRCPCLWFMWCPDGRIDKRVGHGFSGYRGRNEILRQYRGAGTVWMYR